MPFYLWSKTPGANATADPTINYSEGQAPSSLNDSARAAMARLAEFRDDSSGLLSGGGTATAYTLTTNQGLAATPLNGQMIAFRPSANNGTAVTIAVDGGTAYPIQSQPGTAIPSATMLNGTPYVLTFNSSQGAWLLSGYQSNPYGIALGGIMPSTVDEIPNSNFAYANGQAISRTTYATYFAKVGTTYGPGDGTTTFNIIDLRARALFGLDGMGGSSVTSRITAGAGNYNAAVLGTAGGSQAPTIAQANLPAANLSVGGITVTNGAIVVPTVRSLNIANSSTIMGSGDPNTGVVTLSGPVATVSGSIPLGGSGTGLATIPPSVAVPVFVRIF